MVTVKDTPADKLYDDGVPLSAERIIQWADVDISSPAAEILEGMQEIEMDDRTRFATLSAVSHYHYVKTSNVLLCDALLAQPDTPEPAREIVRILLERNGEELDAWSEYIKRCRESGPLGEEQREYFQLIWEQDGVIPILLGIQHINIAADTSYDLFQSDEPVFQQMTAEMQEHNKTVYPAVNEVLREMIVDKDRRERLKILRQIAQQIDVLQLIARQRSNEDVFNVLGTTDVKLVYSTGKRIKQFYSDIGLTEGLLPGLK